ncbi:MAG: V-type ATP synthase subunit A [Promethearchaeota archaeon]
MVNQKISKGHISSINGSVIQVKGFSRQTVGDMVTISEDLNLIGEIIKIVNSIAIIQCYEETAGLKLNATVKNLEYPLSMELAPGLLKSIYDGIQRPLELISNITGDFIARGIRVNSLDDKKKWKFIPKVKNGTVVESGDIIGYVNEYSRTHEVLIPPDFSGEIAEISEGNYNIKEPIYSIKNKRGTFEQTLLTRWPIRIPRPYVKRLMPKEPLITGTRVFDLLFPVARGGVVAVPGGFGTGKTVVQHSLAKFADAEVIVYIGCGERGNEMADLLSSFPELEDPSNHRPLMERTIMIANTSNMPVSAREASIFSGITMAEYYRDMGKNVLLLADSTSRWAEALRELSGRLEEMPTEGGYPAYLATRLSNFYERAGLVQVLGKPERLGSITIIGAVSPPSGDFSEPVTTNTKRFVKSFWALDPKLAYARHYPSINWLSSYSLYDNLAEYWEEHINKNWEEYRTEVNNILSKEAELESVAKLIGPENLPPDQQLVLYTSNLIKEGFLIQNGFNINDRYSSPKKTMDLISVILKFYNESLALIKRGVPFFRFKEIDAINAIRRARLDIGNDHLEELETIDLMLSQDLLNIQRQYAELL